VDFEEHLDAETKKILRSLAKGYGGDDLDLRADCYQAGVLKLIELHEGTYQHKAALLTYGWMAVKGVMLEEVKRVKTEHRYGVTDEMDDLQEMAERAHGRYPRNGYPGERIHLDRLYPEPIEGIRPPLEQSISPEDEKLAQRVWEALSEDDRRYLEASYEHSNVRAAEFLTEVLDLDKELPVSTYRDRLNSAILRAKKLARTL
jgi:hypothetical protein